MSYACEMCASCRHGFKIRGLVFDCLGCGKEICDDCGWMYWQCKSCCVGKSEAWLLLESYAAGWCNVEDEEADAALLELVDEEAKARP